MISAHDTLKEKLTTYTKQASLENVINIQLLPLQYALHQQYKPKELAHNVAHSILSLEEEEPALTQENLTQAENSVAVMLRVAELKMLKLVLKPILQPERTYIQEQVDSYIQQDYELPAWIALYFATNLAQQAAQGETDITRAAYICAQNYITTLAFSYLYDCIKKQILSETKIITLKKPV